MAVGEHRAERVDTTTTLLTGSREALGSDPAKKRHKLSQVFVHCVHHKFHIGTEQLCSPEI